LGGSGGLVEEESYGGGLERLRKKRVSGTLSRNPDKVGEVLRHAKNKNGRGRELENPEKQWWELV